MSESGHNLRIPFSRRGCRLPFETAAVGVGYASFGPVIPGYMTPEEIVARYGPPRPPANQNKPLSRRQLEYVVQKCRSWYHAAKVLKVRIARLKSEMAEQGIQPPAKWEEVETVNLIAQTTESVALQEPASDKASAGKLMPGMVREVGGTPETVHRKTRLEIAREKLDRDGYLKLKGQLGTDKAIIAQLGIATDVFYRLKDEWGVSYGRRQEIEAGGTQFSSGPSGQGETVSPPAANLNSTTDLLPVGGPEQDGASCPLPISLNDRTAIVETVLATVKSLLPALVETQVRARTDALWDALMKRMRHLDVSNAESMLCKVGRDVATHLYDIEQVRTDLGLLLERFDRHRHQVGPGHYSERPDNAK